MKTTGRSPRKSQSTTKKPTRLRTSLRSKNKIAAILTVLVVACVGLGMLVSSSALTTDINRSDKDAVNAAYWASWDAAFKTSLGWTGSISGCKAGDISSAGRGAMRNAVNFARRLNHLKPVGAGNSTANINTQKTALMMAANDKLSHYPTSSWKCYTSAGAQTAAKSNIALHYSTAKAGYPISQYMSDYGASNIDVGHRRWLLYPDANVFGFGATSTSSAIQVTGLSTAATNPNPGWVAWPSWGWFPAPVEPGGRWSLSSGIRKATFRDATVKVWHNGTRISVTRHKPSLGYGRPTLAWEMPDNFSKTGNYRVLVENVKRTDSSTVYSWDYTVRFFEPWK